MALSKTCTSCDATTFQIPEQISQVPIFDPEDAYYLENDLTFSKKVSLLFILHGKATPKYALQILTLDLMQSANNPKTNHVFDWITKHKDQSRNWLDELTEALAILKCNAITRKMGCYPRQSIRTRFLPHISGAGIFVHPILKELYLLCEDLLPDEASELVQFVHQQHPDKNMTRYDSKYLEINMLEWMANEVISVGNWDERSVSSCELGVIFKWLDIQSKFKESKSLQSVVDRYVSSQKYDELDEKKEATFVKDSSNKKASNNETFDDLDVYRLQPDSIGYFLIFNQVLFKSEELELKTRNGSDKDVTRLLETFQSFGYNVKDYNNLKRNDILKTIETFAKKSASKDSIVICFLSHGGIEFVYSSDCERIMIPELEKLLLVDELIGKPKVLIIQACQGESLMEVCKVENTSRLESDGIVIAPRYTDMCVFHSTVPGFVAYRDTEQGTWFIKALCEKIMQFYKRLHLNDIFIKVVQEVSSKREFDQASNRTVTMTPNCQKNTFTKRFLFPHV